MVVLIGCVVAGGGGSLGIGRRSRGQLSLVDVFNINKGIIIIISTWSLDGSLELLFDAIFSLFDLIGKESLGEVSLVFSDVLVEALCSLEDVVLKLPAGSVGSGSEVVELVLSVWLEQVPVALEARLSLLCARLTLAFVHSILVSRTHSGVLDSLVITGLLLLFLSCGDWSVDLGVDLDEHVLLVSHDSCKRCSEKMESHLL
jgi:hypothetical protein